MIKRKIVIIIREIMKRWGIHTGKQLAQLTNISERTAQRLLNIHDTLIRFESINLVFCKLRELTEERFSLERAKKERELLDNSYMKIVLLIKQDYVSSDSDQ